MKQGRQWAARCNALPRMFEMTQLLALDGLDEMMERGVSVTQKVELVV